MRRRRAIWLLLLLLLILIVGASARRTFEERVAGMRRATQRAEETAALRAAIAKAAAAAASDASVGIPPAIVRELQDSAADGANDTALAALAERLLLGDAQTAPDAAAAWALAESAAAAGNPRAHSLLGVALSAGRAKTAAFAAAAAASAPQAAAMAHFWMAAAAGDEVGLMALATRQMAGRGTPPACIAAADAFSRLSADVAAAADEQAFLFARAPHLRLAEASEWAEGDGSSGASGSSSARDVLPSYQFRADIGDVAAGVALGHVYAHGLLGVGRDYALAREYFDDAARQGDAGGMAGLGYLHEHGLGVAQSNETALRYYRKAAAANSPAALTRLGQLYMRGEIVAETPDRAKAAKYFEAAAKLGWPQAHVHLGDFALEDGDRAKAMKYYAGAAQVGSVAAMHELGMLYLEDSDVTPGACLTACSLLRKAALTGDWVTVPMLEAEELFFDGKVDAALARYELCAEMGVEEAQMNAAWIHERAGRYDQALRYYKESALSEGSGTIKIAGDEYRAGSIVKLAEFYLRGLGVEPNASTAAELFSEAALANAQAAFSLGWLYQTGNGVPQDLYLAKRYYDMAGSHPNTALAYYPALVGIGLHHVYKFVTAEESDFLVLILASCLLAVLISLRYAARQAPRREQEHQHRN